MEKFKNIIQSKNILVVVSLLVGLLLGWLFFSSNNEMEHNHSTGENTSSASSWTCSMHPQINLPEPGKCPICGMDLIPKSDLSATDDSPIRLQMTAQAVNLANIQTTTVGTEASNGESNKSILLNGTVQEDERKIYSQTAHFAGRIENLAVNFKGDYVSKGQTIATLYSPPLVSAQQELLESHKLFKNQPEIIESAREKLRRWKLSDEQIAKIESSKEIITTFPIKSNFSGVVKELKVSLGDHLMEGEVMMTISDLSHLWVEFEVYESELPFIHVGDEIEFTVNGIADKTFKSKITFIDPIIAKDSRIATVRTEVSNIGRQLKPEMYARGKLVAKSNNGSKTTQMLTVPRSAVMWTGKRSLVYVSITDAQVPTFEAREVTLGLALEDAYEILDGLKAGDEVVTNGTFTVDAAAQLNNKGSMMNRDVMVKNASHEHHMIDMEMPDFSDSTKPEFKKKQEEFLNEYFELKNALVTSEYELAKKHNAQMLKLIEGLASVNSAEADEYLKKQKSIIIKHSKAINQAKNIDAQRKYFIELSQAIIALRKAFGGEENLFVQYCPMADNNNGAYWLSQNKEVRNPYYGDMMLTCGEVKETLKSE
ncbi:efflux RND transporter periplasmic adaptor subunit [Chondrinema litorale]|uniref:efflux RND transporter periplasmic adaptor subunit n=1 Tax=Chondrinema litorale TaxID=2994555 RepID=UPI002542F3B2|nr:efflux RND transporter periplasmic adaptor subunit [Chondrinema litorale]UZR93018.1 efflux RND transporter periplasmic adaptor subunit [Chondrinema litorale]